MTVWVVVGRYVGGPDGNPQDAPREARGRRGRDQVPDKVGASGAGRRDRRRSDPQKKGHAAESKMVTSRPGRDKCRRPYKNEGGTRQQAELVRRAKTGRRNPADLAGACSGGKFVVSRAGEA